MTIAGLLLQLGIFTTFLTTTAIFNHRLLRNPTPSSSNHSIRWKRHIATLYLSGTLILIRSAFRVAEFMGGPTSKLMKDEVWMYGFDMVLMTIVMAWMAWVHPSEIEIVGRGEVGACGNGWRVLVYKRGKVERLHSGESMQSWVRDEAV